LPASGWEMMAKVRRRAASAAGLVVLMTLADSPPARSCHPSPSATQKWRPVLRERRAPRLAVALHRLDQEVAAFDVLDLHHPEVRVDARGAGHVGVDLGLVGGGLGPPPDALAVATH